MEHIEPIVVYTAVAAYHEGLGVEDFPSFEESEQNWVEICEYATQLIANNYKFDDPSPFKVVASLCIAISKLAQIPIGWSDAVFASHGIEAVEDFNCPRLVPSITGIRVGLVLLHKAEVGKIDPKTNRGRVLERKIKISKHYCKDFAHVVSKEGRCDEPQIDRVSLVFETLAYKYNPDAEDPDAEDPDAEDPDAEDPSLNGPSESNQDQEE